MAFSLLLSCIMKSSLPAVILNQQHKVAALLSKDGIDSSTVKVCEVGITSQKEPCCSSALGILGVELRSPSSLTVLS